MKKIFLTIFLLKTSIYANAMTSTELNYLKEYPHASKATVVLDYLFIEDNRGNILEQCFIPKDGTKSCYPEVVQDQKKSKEGFVTLLNTLTKATNAIAESYEKQAEVYKDISKTIPLSQPTSLNKSKTTFNCINVGVNTTCREQ